MSRSLTYVYPGAYDYIEKFLYNRYVKFGKIETYQCAYKDGYEIRMVWKHGQNHYSIVHYITRHEMVQWSARGEIINIVLDMVNIRDQHIKNVTFWTNCKDVR